MPDAEARDGLVRACERARQRRYAAIVTIGLLAFSNLLTVVRAAHIPASTQEIAFRGLTFSIACLIICIGLYSIIERLPRLGFPALAVMMLPLAIAAGFLTSASLIALHFLVSDGALHRDAETGRLLSVANYWTWFFVAWAGSIIALRYSLAATTGFPDRHTSATAKGPPYAIDLWITDRRKCIRLPVEDIICVEASGDYIVVHTQDRRHMIHQSLSSLAQRLDPLQFMRVHRSWLVRLDAVEEIARRPDGTMHLQLENGATVRVSRAYRRAIRNFHRDSGPKSAPFAHAAEIPKR